VPPVRANASQIYQILMNLGANAAHALSGGGVLTVGLKYIGVTKARAARSIDLHAGEYVCISVQDTGAGMSKETLSRIFEPFFTTKGLEGSGLGMSVVHGLIKDHGGAITVDSEPGKGTKVRVYFPVTLSRSADAHLNKEEAIHGQGQHILYIDDEASLGRAMKRVLDLLGYRCTFYSDPQVALEAFRANPGEFDAVISDMAMPNLSGVDVAREISAIRPDLPIALTSGRIEQDSESVSHFEGVMAWLSKPATIDEIGAVLATMLQDHADDQGDDSRPL
jgi:CheY-like chemotaxis protein